jgi:type I restriction enzyme, S subunit
MKAVWDRKQLGDICEIVNGGTPRTGVLEYWGGDHFWITPAEMGKRLSPYVDDTVRKITDSGLQNSSARLLPRNSVILSSRAPIGHLVINTEPMATNQGCKGLVPTSQLASKFLYYYLASNVDLLNALGTGTTFKELSSAKLKEVPIPFPLPSEQERIVAILDEAFDRIATAKTNGEKNLQNARALFDSYLDSVFTRGSEEWAHTQLGEVCTFENGDRGTNYPSKAVRTVSGIPFINAGHLTEDGIDLERMDYISRERFNLLGAGKISPGDILFCLRGSLGKVASVGGLSEGAIASSLVIVRPSPLVLGPFILAYFRSRICSEMIRLFRNGAAQPNLSAGSLKKFAIKIPLLSIQKKIVHDLDAMRDETRSLESIYREKLAALEALKKELLHQAFTGAL